MQTKDNFHKIRLFMIYPFRYLADFRYDAAWSIFLFGGLLLFRDVRSHWRTAHVGPGLFLCFILNFHIFQLTRSKLRQAQKQALTLFPPLRGISKRWAVSIKAIETILTLALQQI